MKISQASISKTMTDTGSPILTCFSNNVWLKLLQILYITTDELHKTLCNLSLYYPPYFLRSIFKALYTMEGYHVKMVFVIIFMKSTMSIRPVAKCIASDYVFLLFLPKTNKQTKTTSFDNNSSQI